MKKFTLLVFLVSVLLTTLHGQNIELTFTAIDNVDYTQLDSIKVMNQTQGSDTVLYYPDTVLSIILTGFNEFIPNDNGFHLFQNYPNPVTDKSTVTLQLPESGIVKIKVTDILGRTVIQSNQELEKGTNSFIFTPGEAELYFFTVQYKNVIRSIKVLCSPMKFDHQVSLDYIGLTDEMAELKASKAVQDFIFNNGDELLCVGYYDMHQSGFLYSPEGSNSFIFQFAYDIPCPGTPTVEYEGQIYNTVQIMSQCWLKENLNVGTRINADTESTDNIIIEKYCYEDLESNCQTYGGLYQWDEMMKYTTLGGPSGVQGICPSGWHIPNNDEWKLLFGTVDSHYGVGDPEWDEFDCGFDVGKRLKSKTGWVDDGNGNDDFGFNALPAGLYMYFYPGSYGNINWSTDFRTSNEDESWSTWNWNFHKNHPTTWHYADEKEFGYSVRCIKD